MLGDHMSVLGDEEVLPARSDCWECRKAVSRIRDSIDSVINRMVGGPVVVTFPSSGRVLSQSEIRIS